MSDAPIDPAIFAALRAIVHATEPFAEVADKPAMATAQANTVVVWALDHGFELTAEQVRTLRAAFDLVCLALRQAESETRH